jgi:cobalamin biosynthesis Mg chelatase CobN
VYGLARGTYPASIGGERLYLQCSKEQSMTVKTIMNKHLLALACCLVLVLVPAMARAQGGILGQAEQGVKKGAQGVQKGVETGVEKTKEGAESVGHETKKVITGKDDTSADRQKPTTQSTTPSETTTKGTTSKSTTGTKTTEETKGGKHLPGTAGELPLLALVGSLALAGAVVTRLVRRTQ